MKQVFLALALLIVGTSAQAKKSCTDAPKEKWMSEADFKQKVQSLGYTINKFKQPGTCYEIYGKNKDGKNIETYFNPVDGSVVKEEID